MSHLSPSSSSWTPFKSLTVRCPWAQLRNAALSGSLRPGWIVLPNTTVTWPRMAAPLLLLCTQPPQGGTSYIWSPGCVTVKRRKCNIPKLAVCLSYSVRCSLWLELTATVNALLLNQKEVNQRAVSSKRFLSTHSSGLLTLSLKIFNLISQFCFHLVLVIFFSISIGL